MKRIAILIILCTTSVSIASSQDFRKNSWGDSMEKVKLTEGNRDWKDVNTSDDFTTMIFFNDTVEGLKAIVLFKFFEDQLCFASVSFAERHHNNNDYIRDYNHINESFQNKYGSVKIDWEWSVETFKDSTDMWGDALKEEHLHIFTEWGIPNMETPKTLVDHSIGGTGKSILHGFRYHSVFFSRLLEDRKIQNAP